MDPRKVFSATICTCSFVLCSALSAATIVDTGPGDTVPGGTPIGNGNAIAGQFIIEAPVIIESIEGWASIDVNGSLMLVITESNFNGFPSDGGFGAGIETTTESNTPQWIGAYGLSLRLDPGAYFISFQTAPSFTAQGRMPTRPENPLGRYVFSNDGLARTWSTTPLKYGFRIEGTVVPLPGSLWFMLAGVGFLAGIRGAGSKRTTD